jgi:hypothetical protein
MSASQLRSPEFALATRLARVAVPLPPLMQSDMRGRAPVTSALFLPGAFVMGAPYLGGRLNTARPFLSALDRKLFQNSIERVSQADERHPVCPLSRPHNRERFSPGVGHRNAELGTINQAVPQQSGQ